MSKLIIANWKSQKTVKTATDWWKTFASELDSKMETKVAIAAPFTLLSTLQPVLQPSVALAAQDVSPYPMGSYTGAVNAEQLKDLSVRYVIVGHSERRRHFHETYEDVARKVTEALNAGLHPVLCLDKDYITEQAAALDPEQYGKLIIAYEPLAAIGSGQPEDVGTVQTVITEIKATFGEVPVLYGGSVDERNSNEYLLVSDGLLVGGASLKAETFLQIVSQKE